MNRIWDNTIIETSGVRNIAGGGTNASNAGQALLNLSGVSITGNQTISGLKNFASRPTVNNTGVLLSGEAINARNDRYWTTGISIGNSSYTIPYANGSFSGVPTVLVTLDVTGSTVFNCNIKNRTTGQFTLLFPSNLTENVTLNVRATI